MGGAVLTETVFAIPGMGFFMVQSIASRDFPIIQGGVLMIAIIFSFVNLLVDILYGFVDPRIRSQYK
jgi:peptide/nickel transport system permease protein